MSSKLLNTYRPNSRRLEGVARVGALTATQLRQNSFRRRSILNFNFFVGAAVGNGLNEIS